MILPRKMSIAFRRQAHVRAAMPIAWEAWNSARRGIRGTVFPAWTVMIRVIAWRAKSICCDCLLSDCVPAAIKWKPPPSNSLMRIGKGRGGPSPALIVTRFTAKMKRGGQAFWTMAVSASDVTRRKRAPLSTRTRPGKSTPASVVTSLTDLKIPASFVVGVWPISAWNATRAFRLSTTCRMPGIENV